MMAQFLSRFHPKKLLLAGVLAGAVSVLPATATFGKARPRQVLPRAGSVLVPAVPPAGAPRAEAPETPTDALFYDIPPSHADPEWLARIKCDTAATTDESSGLTAVTFSGYVTWQNERFPEELPSPTTLTIELQDASSDGNIQDRPLLYIHQQEVSDVYEKGVPITYSFCAKVPEVKQYGLYTRVQSGTADDGKTKKSSNSSQLSFAGLTDIEAGLKEYKNVRVRLFNAVPRESGTQAGGDKDETLADAPEDVEEEPLADGTRTGSDTGAQRAARDSGHPTSTPTVNGAFMPAGNRETAPLTGVEVCNFSVLKPGTRGVATRVIMEVPPPLANTSVLPNPTVLTVLLEEMAQAIPGEGLVTEAEPLAVFSSDIAQWYTAGEELTALLCAQLPVQSEKAEMSYKLRSILNVGWDGLAEGNDEDVEDPDAVEPVQLRSGDYTAETILTVVPDKDSYVVRAPLVHYES